MNIPTTDNLQEMAAEAETNGSILANSDPHRPLFHMKPPVGWLNDPNGLCWMGGTCHAFFQYDPHDAQGKGKKYWGHYVSCNLLNWEYRGIFLCPDTYLDKDGVYSGCAFVDDGGMHLFYTGNVKEKGEHDYVYTGRTANQILVDSDTGMAPGKKQLLLTNADYPENCTCHVRDPKVWRQEETYYMVLGARLKDNRGAALLYRSDDFLSWNFEHQITSQQPFGYMWECPDYLCFGGQCFLAACPQGVERGYDRFQNIYQTGYFKLEQTIYDTQLIDANSFYEWDKGFDFYAPQTFTDAQGRCILIGWMGLPDIESEYGNPTISYGWQHIMTLPRVITCENGKLYQKPPVELETFRKNQRTAKPDGLTALTSKTYEIMIAGFRSPDFCLFINHDIRLCYKDQTFTMEFLNDTGSGRQQRRSRLDMLRSLRVILDTSCIEVFINDGEYVFSSRYYPVSNESVRLNCEADYCQIWDLEVN